jgi:hypothetical protein
MELTAADIADDLVTVVDGLRTVNVVQIHPDTGAELSTATGVQGMRRQLDGEAVTADDGEVRATRVKWHLRVSDIAFTLRQRHRIVDGSDTWVITKPPTMAAMGTRYVCETTRYPG